MQYFVLVNVIYTEASLIVHQWGINPTVPTVLLCLTLYITLAYYPYKLRPNTLLNNRRSVFEINPHIPCLWLEVQVPKVTWWSIGSRPWSHSLYIGNFRSLRSAKTPHFNCFILWNLLFSVVFVHCTKYFIVAWSWWTQISLNCSEPWWWTERWGLGVSMWLSEEVNYR